MPQPASRRERKQKLWQPKPVERPGACRYHRISPASARAIASEACGLVRYSVVAPRTASQAHASAPTGPISIEYGEARAVSTRNDVFDPEHNRYGRRRFEDVLPVSEREQVGEGLSALVWLIHAARNEQEKSSS